MKLAIALLISTLTFAGVCETQLDGYTLSDVRAYDEGDATFFNLIGEGDFKMTKEEFAANRIFNQWDDIDESYEYCKDAMRYLEFSHPTTGEEFKAIYTIEDSCDGGNSFGYITKIDSTDIVAEIGDSEFYCPSK
ncbi:hypothetical protein [Bacteriovorax sp. Seq25_V]|uniref:hypothetical protein n=1 Tax=Bacteriovorax sp. Seq25_V TaxID=1201288 RepID=UPI00038A3174|nr:hypothetical protein [Bacteriovorax sp. Seq25_V]EQC43728.1 hypothetical protein M900_1467 [Bacteriovorax sp. Seq25_V]